MDRKPSGTWAPMPPPKNQAWEEASRDKDLSNPIPYSPKTIFQVGDVLTHPKFGIGIVMGQKEGGKIIVIFQQSTNRLVHGLR